MSTLTLKNIPDGLHAQLKASAERNRRSLNSEILARLDQGLEKPAVDAAQYARSLHAFTAALPRLDHRKIARYKARGRVWSSLTAT